MSFLGVRVNASQVNQSALWSRHFSMKINGSTTAAAVCRTSEGTPIFVVSSFLKSQNSNQGEAIAMLKGIQEAKKLQIKKLTIAGDSLVALQALEDPENISD